MRECHRTSEQFASKAEQMIRSGNNFKAARLYAKAAELEEQAFVAIDATKLRTRAIIGMSAAALWYKAGVYSSAERLANSLLDDPITPEFAKIELRILLAAVIGRKTLTWKDRK